MTKTAHVKEGVISELHASIRLVIRGAVSELTECYNVLQPEADILVLTAAYSEIDRALGGDCITPLDFANESIRTHLEVAKTP